MERVLPVVTSIASRYPERTVFTRFLTRAYRPTFQACGGATIHAGNRPPGTELIRHCWSWFRPASDAEGAMSGTRPSRCPKRRWLRPPFSGSPPLFFLGHFLALLASLGKTDGD